MHFIYCENCGIVIGFAEFEAPKDEYYICPRCAERILQLAAPKACKEE